MRAMAAIDEKYDAQLKALVPINGLSPEYRQQVLAQAEKQIYGRGQYVFREGDRDTYAFYILEGELDLSAKSQLVKHVVGGTEDAAHALAQLQPRQLSARVSKEATVLKVDRTLLDKLLALDGTNSGQASAQAAVEVIELNNKEDADWMTRMLQSELFSRVPAANIQRIFTKMEVSEYSAGDTVVKQGGPGDYYYVIQSGRCKVIRNTSQGNQSIELAEIGPGDSFGEEALVADSHRNASVVMVTDGELRRLTKEDFIELIKDPLLHAVDYERAENLVSEGAIWLDVRFPEEFKKEALDGATNIPLNVLRLQVEKLAIDKAYVTCCDSGTRSSVAAYLLAERGYDTHYLQGGLAAYGLLSDMPATINVPQAGEGVADIVQFPPNTQPAAPIPASHQSVGEQQHSGVRLRSDLSADPNDTTLDADVKAQALKAELAKATMQLDEARRMKEEAETARVAAEQAAEQRVQTERERLQQQAKIIEEEKTALEQAANAAVKAERQKLIEATTKAEQAAKAAEEAAADKIKAERERLAQEAKRAETEKRAAEEAAQAVLEAERKRLAEEARKVEEARQAAEQAAEKQIKSERQRLEQQAEQARQTWEEAQKLKEEIEQARQVADQEATRRHEEQEDRILRMQEEAEQRLQEEEQRLEQTYAWQAEELAKLQKLKEDAEDKLTVERDKVATESEAARQRLAEARRIQKQVEVTKDEAAREAETRHQRQLELERKLRDEVQEKIQEERRKLEAEFARNAEELDRARSEKEAAEAARVAAAEEAERIIEEFKESHEKLRKQEEAKLNAERMRLVAEAKQIESALGEARQARQEAADAQRNVERDMAKLKQMQSEQKRRTSPAAKRLASDIAAIEKDVAEARANVVVAERAQKVAQAAERENQEDMERHIEAEVTARGKFEIEIADWVREQEEIDNSPVQQQILANQREHLERIKKRAQSARRDAKFHDQSLIDELAKQLTDT